MRKQLILLFLAATLASPLMAIDSQVEFTAEVVGINPVSDEEIELMMALTPGFELTVRVTEETELKDENDDPLDISELAVGMTLKVEGLFTDQGILAREAEVVVSGSQLEVRGEIEAIDPDSRQITVLGFLIGVPETAEIKNSEGDPLAFDELLVGQFVKVEANLEEDSLVATEVKVRGEDGGEDKEPVRIHFRGIVSSLGESQIVVLIEGLGETTVLLTPQTDIKGDLEEGVLAQVKGIILEDLSVEARKIHVKRLLQLAPGKLKMKVEQTRRVEVILRETLGEEVELAITSQDPAVALATTETVIIPADKITAFFEVQALSEGETSIDVTMPAELGGLVITLQVQVGAQRDEDPRDPRLNWSPGTLNISTGATDTARLKINHAGSEDLVVMLSVVEGEEGLVAFPAEVIIPAGERVVTVEFQVGDTPGELRVRATLPESAGGDSDDMKIKIRENRKDKDKRNEDDEEED